MLVNCMGFIVPIGVLATMNIKMNFADMPSGGHMAVSACAIVL